MTYFSRFTFLMTFRPLPFRPSSGDSDIVKNGGMHSKI